MPPPAPLEIEAKLAAASEADLRAIGALEQLGPYALRSRAEVKLRSIYFDTPELILARHAIALRARRLHRQWEVTLKWAGEVHGAVHARPELTEPLAQAPGNGAPRLSPTFRREITALLAGRRLRPILVTDIRRQLRDVRRTVGGDQAPVAEVALDRVALHAPDERDARASYFEIEVELKRGAAEDVDEIARLLQQQFHLAPSAETKFSHGMSLLHGPRLAAFEPPLADGSLRRLAQRLVGRQLQRLRFNDPGTRRGDEPEALHDMRVASRRLRALLRSLGGAFPVRRAERMRSELRWLNGLLSPVRDCDVQLHTLETYEAALAAERRAALEPYRQYILRERQRHREAMQSGLDSKRYFSVLLWLEQFSIEPKPARPATASLPAAEAGRKALKHAFRKLLQRGTAVGSMPTAEELHRIRIRAKRLRYLLEFFHDSSGKAGQRLLKQLVRLQDLLGAHNDARVAAAFLERYVNGPGADSSAPTLLTLGGFLEDELRRGRKARAKYHRTWTRFAARRTMKDWKAVQRRLKREADAVGTRGAARAAPAAKGRV